jgi:hypothetical protein
MKAFCCNKYCVYCTQYSPWRLNNSSTRFFKQFKRCEQDFVCDSFLLALETCQVNSSVRPCNKLNLKLINKHESKIYDSLNPSCCNNFTLLITTVTMQTALSISLKECGTIPLYCLLPVCLGAEDYFSVSVTHISVVHSYINCTLMGMTHFFQN